MPRGRVAAGERGRPQVGHALEALRGCCRRRARRPRSSRRRRSRCRPGSRPATRRSHAPRSASTEATWARWCCTATRLGASSDGRRTPSERYCGWASCTTSSSLARARAYIASRSCIVSSSARAGLVVIEVADVLAHERLAVDHQGDGVLEVGAEREHRPGDRAARPRRRARSRGSAGASPAPSGPQRTTESSTRRAIGRSPTRSASASPASRARASPSS